MITKLTLVLLALLSHLDESAALSDEPNAVGPVAIVQVELLPDLEGAEVIAEALETRLATAGLAHAVRIEIVPGEPELPLSYRVLVGPFVEFEDAERARTELDRLGVDGFVREFEPLIGC
jgi:cell division septation protein DedD